MDNTKSNYHEESPLLARDTTTATATTGSGQARTTRPQIKLSKSKPKPKPKSRQPNKSTPYNVRSMLVHSPYIPARALNTNKRQKMNFYRKRRKGQGHGAFIDSGAESGVEPGYDIHDNYSTWVGRIGVHVVVEYFDLKLLIKDVFPKTHLFSLDKWEVMEFDDADDDVIRLVPSLSLSEPCPSLECHDSTAATTAPVGNGCSVEPAKMPFSGTKLVETDSCTGLENISQEATLVIYSDEEEQITPPLANQYQQPGNNVGNTAAGPASTPEVYILSFGAIVFWNFENEKREQMWIDKYLFAYENQQVGYNDQSSYHDNVEDDDANDDNASDYDGDNDDVAIGERYHEEAIESAKDEMSFCYGNKFHLRHDMAQLRTREYGEKIAVSFALAKSANLSIFEWRLDQAIERNSHIPQKLAKYGRIGMHRKEISREIGRIYLVKSGIHLENNILDTPVYFWEDDKFSSEYENAMEYFDITSRIQLVNTRLEVLSDLYEMLIDAAQTTHGTFLEWTVIILIIFEIIIEIIRAYRDDK